MNSYSDEDLLLAEKTLYSALRKNDKVILTLQSKASPNQGLILRTQRQSEHLHIIYDFIQASLNDLPDPYEGEDLRDTLRYIDKLLLQLHNLLPKIKEGSAQETTLLRRIFAFEMAQELMRSYR